MLGFIARRVISLFVVLLIAVSITFCLLRVAPGDAFNLSEKQNTPENQALQRKKYNLDGPIWWDLARYIGVGKKNEEKYTDGTVREPAGYRGLLQGNFDASLKLKDRRVGELLGQTLPISVSVGLLALIIATT